VDKKLATTFTHSTSVGTCVTYTGYINIVSPSFVS